VTINLTGVATKERKMTYRAYYGTRGSHPIAPLEKDRWPSRQFFDLDQALEWASCVVRKGTVVLAIDGDDGTQLTKQEIAAALASRVRIFNATTAG